MTQEMVLTCTGVLIIISLLIQTVEMSHLARKISLPDSPWNWSNVARDFSGCSLKMQKILNWLFGPHFLSLIHFQTIAIFLFFLYPHFSTVLLLVFSASLIAVRFRGLFNGGSDAMTMVVLLGLGIAQFGFKAQPNPFNLKVGFGFIAFQLTLSYFIAGVIKLKEFSWRSGHALRVFLNRPHFPVPSFLQVLGEKPQLSLVISWVVILWECTFPVVWVMPAWTSFYLAVGILFHAMNFIVFGLNRFFFAWIAAYPALIYCTQRAL